MKAIDRCPKYPSMPKEFCSHCQGTGVGTENNPRFSIKESFLNEKPLVEILKNGGPVHLFDSHFTFGLSTAILLLKCIEVLREFWKSTDEERRTFENQTIEDKEGGYTIDISVEMHPDFVRSTGEMIDRPWLQIVVPWERIGLGMMKCRAVCEVEDQLANWLEKNDIRAPKRCRP